MEDYTGMQEETDASENGSLKPKVLVIMGATGAGKSRLAVDLASHFPIEIINADSMQVYQGLDVLTNKVPLQDQRGVPHHLLGTINPKDEFTSKNFRDSAIALIDDILARNRTPVIVGGTNYYIQALVSPFLLDDSIDETDEYCSIPMSHLHDSKQPEVEYQLGQEKLGYERLRCLDPVAANRIHPNDERKINQYLNLYTRSGVLPSVLLKGKTMEGWGRVDNSKYNCCFICVDASLPVLDKYVEQRVDLMVDDGLLREVYDINYLDANYSRGLQQAIGVREFEDFMRAYICIVDTNGGTEEPGLYSELPMEEKDPISQEILVKIMNFPIENQLKSLLVDAIERVKGNTRRLVRRQKRRIKKLQTMFGWNVHFVDATETLQYHSNDSWVTQVVEPSVKIVKSFLDSSMPCPEVKPVEDRVKLNERDLWSQHVCKACGDRVLRGAYEWEQHTQGRGHRKRVSRLKKLAVLESECIVDCNA